MQTCPCATAHNPQAAHLPTSPPILDLPPEILQEILSLAYSDDKDSHGIPVHLTRRLALFKKNILPVCRRFYDLGLHALYSHVHIGHPRAFDVFRHELAKNPKLGAYVKCLDFSDFTSIGLGRTRKMNREIQMVTCETITDALLQMPNLREFLVSEALEDDLGKDVLQTVFNRQKYLEAVDFCGASSDSFVSSMTSLKLELGSLEYLSRVGFHECVSLPAQVYEHMLPRLGRLERLDLTHTHVSARALMSIPERARITHLSLAKCRNVSPKAIVGLLTTHPAVTSGSLEWLSLQWTDLSAEDLTAVLEGLKRTAPKLRYLSLYGLPVEEAHLEQIGESVEELSLGFADVEIDSLITAFSGREKLRYLDLTGNPHITLWTVGDMRLLRGIPSVRTWEFDLTKILLKMTDVRLPGYTVVIGQGRRGWIFRGEKNKDALNVEHHCASPEVRSAHYCQHVLGMDMGSTEAWAGASRKIDCSGVQYGGGLERGIYLYYAYRIR
ncbi:hypothetical protein BZA70DRAFT_249848 [Myxozyma melibiosi]|uniref:F-box domain-containing protein n=1 Tax=Myxozyma melibiosi TaxID=54550 RepID=A0ABR1F2W7_9ASCO